MPRTCSGSRTTSMPSIGRRPAGGPQQRRQHLDGGRLARAVGPDEAEDVALLQLEGQVLDGRQVLILFSQVLDIDHHH